MAKKRIGIFTGGGDVPGLNIAIKSVVLNACEDDYEVIGIRRGWGGLLNYEIGNQETHNKYIRPLTPFDVRRVDRSGGTFLHTSRTNPSHVRPREVPEFLKDSPKGKVVNEETGAKDYTKHILEVLEHLGIDSLITIGGDDTLSYSVQLHQAGFPVVGIPKTMDNDVLGTDYCIGFSTAVTQAVSLITHFRTSVGSHERIGVVELFGRNSGETSLITGYLSYVDRTIICEVPFNLVDVSEMLAKDKRDSPSHYSLCVISEGAVTDSGLIVESGEEDAYGHKKLGGIGDLLSEQIKILTGNNTMYQKLGYLLRSGPADMLDRMVAMNYGALAMQMTKRKDFGNMVSIMDGNYSEVPLEMVTSGKRQVDVDLYYDAANYRPKIKNILGLPMFLH
jgi:6-phosphofructokinase 1